MQFPSEKTLAFNQAQLHVSGTAVWFQEVLLLFDKPGRNKFVDFAESRLSALHICSVHCAATWVQDEMCNIVQCNMVQCATAPGSPDWSVVTCTGVLHIHARLEPSMMCLINYTGAVISCSACCMCGVSLSCSMTGCVQANTHINGAACWKPIWMKNQSCRREKCIPSNWIHRQKAFVQFRPRATTGCVRGSKYDTSGLRLSCIRLHTQKSCEMSLRQAHLREFWGYSTAVCMIKLLPVTARTTPCHSHTQM